MKSSGLYGGQKAKKKLLNIVQTTDRYTNKKN